MRSHAPGAPDARPKTQPERVADFERAMRRLNTRVRNWSVARWEAAGALGPARTEVAYQLALTLAMLARRAGNGSPDQPPPRVAPHAIADQLVVLGRELAEAPEAAACADEATAAVGRAGAAL